MKPGRYVVAGRRTFFVKGRPVKPGDVIHVTALDTTTEIIKYMAAMGVLTPEDVVEAKKPMFPKVTEPVMAAPQEPDAENQPRRRKRDRSDES